MIVCPHCGTQNKDAWKFCLGCGRDLPTSRGAGAAPRPESDARVYRGRWRVKVRRSGPGMADVFVLERIGNVGPGASTIPSPPGHRPGQAPRPPVVQAPPARPAPPAHGAPGGQGAAPPRAPPPKPAAPEHRSAPPRLPKMWMPLPAGRPGSPAAGIPPEPAAPGETRFGMWRLGRLLGRAGMVDLYEADHVLTGWKGWVKTIVHDSSGPGEACVRFWREVEIIVGLPRQYVAGLLDAGQTPDGWPFIVMQPLRGETLDRRLRGRVALEVPEAIAIARGAAEALGAIHAAGIVHRDVKPANLFLAEQAPRVRLLDFGIAQPVRTDRHLTPEGSIVGTPLYMAPEAMRGLPVDHRADIYGLGCVLFEMLSGEPPLAGAQSMNEIMYRAVTGRPEPPRGARGPIPPPHSKLVLRMLDADPSQRPASCHAVIEELYRLQPQ